MMLIARGPPKRVENPFRFGLFFLQFFLIFLFLFFSNRNLSEKYLRRTSPERTPNHDSQSLTVNSQAVCSRCS